MLESVLSVIADDAPYREQGLPDLLAACRSLTRQRRVDPSLLGLAAAGLELCGVTGLAPPPAPAPCGPLWAAALWLHLGQNTT